jgi:hypothetical protein
MRVSIEFVFKYGSLAPDEGAQQLSVEQYNSELKWTTELNSKLAAHAYLLEHGRQATTWSELVPGYLKSVPGMPFPGNTNQLSVTELEDLLELPIHRELICGGSVMLQDSNTPSH